jgi:alanine-glyoxylate transaminase / (R)-3-amino-2-methylpropionate-pyruvate transaminase
MTLACCLSKQFAIQLCSQLNIVEGKMQYLYDEHGKRYLDCFGGIVTVSCGHCHPDIVNAVVEQTKLLQHTTTIYLHHTIVEFAEALTSKMPGNLKVKVMSVWVQS